MLQKGTVKDYICCSLYHRDYPAAIKDDNSSMDGCLLVLQTFSQRRKLDNFEGESYKLIPVTITIDDIDKPGGERIEADMYV
jgi:hypothetical protein